MGNWSEEWVNSVGRRVRVVMDDMSVVTGEVVSARVSGDVTVMGVRAEVVEPAGMPTQPGEVVHSHPRHVSPVTWEPSEES